jgi:small subunit ribosomal protein S4
MIRKKKKFKKPKKPFETARISEENELVKKYGLKNKKEVWKAQAKVDYLRGRAKALARLPLEEQEALFNKLKAIGLKTETTADVLDLKPENILERRLPTIIVKKKIANTTSHARQLVVHKKILVDGNIVNTPSYIVPVAKEGTIKLKVKTKTTKPKSEEKQKEDSINDKESDENNTPPNNKPESQTSKSHISSDNETQKESKEQPK